MIKLWKMREKYKVAVLQERLTSWIEEAVTSMSWGGSISEASRIFDFECIKIPDKTNFPAGSVVIVYDSKTDEELMRFVITKISKTRSSTMIKYNCRDIRWWLTRNTIDKKFENMRADEIFISLCKSLAIPIGTVHNTEIVFPVLHFMKKKPWDMLISALTETRKKNGRKFTTRVTEGKLELIEKVTQVRKWVIEENVNLIDATYEESIEDTYTQVKVVGKDSNGNTLTSVQKDEAMQKLYGVMQEYIEQSEETTQGELNTIASQKLKELAVLKKSGTVNTFGIDGVEAGNAIYVIDKETGLVGGFYVDSDKHQVSKGKHEMTLTLSWTDELPSIEYQAPKDAE